MPLRIRAFVQARDHSAKEATMTCGVEPKKECEQEGAAESAAPAEAQPCMDSPPLNPTRKAEGRMQINPGDVVCDELTGLIGLVIGRTEWLNGCIRCVVHPDKVNDDGTHPQAYWIDEGQLKVVEEGLCSASQKASEEAR